MQIGNKKEELLRQVDDWILLLHLDSDLNAGMCFWDAGIVQFMIRKEDLAQRDFSRVYAELFTL